MVWTFLLSAGLAWPPVEGWTPLTIVLTLCAAGGLAGAGGFAYFKLRRRKSPAEIERLRRLELSRHGRIATGEIVGWVEPENQSGPLIVYRYDVAGVTYEVAQDIAALPEIAATSKQALGGISTVRYEVKHPGNSIIVSEEWSGLPEVKTPAGTAQTGSDETVEQQR